jgi:hypothetical protein
VFSAFNSLKGISALPEYRAVCCYTHDELKTVFSNHAEATAKKLGLSVKALLDRMQAYYGGFCFDGKTHAYSPFSVLQFLDENDFQNYWFETGTSQSLALYLYLYLRNKKLTADEFRGLSVSQNFARPPGELDQAYPESFLYQSGCLSLRPGNSPDNYTLDYPNREVLESMSWLLMCNFSGSERAAAEVKES